ncbi:hypothetical protein C2U63_13415 [Burkholderia pseudomallei]|nr:hypothetical protein C2U63_13415 [Burkholderia pseudomallei]
MSRARCAAGRGGAGSRTAALAISPALPAFARPTSRHPCAAPASSQSRSAAAPRPLRRPPPATAAARKLQHLRVVRPTTRCL